MKLSGAEYKQLQEALLAAFPTQDELEEMVSLELEENLNAIAGGRNLRAVVFNLIQWAEARGRTQELIDCALRANPTSPALKPYHGDVGDSPDSPTTTRSSQSGGDKVSGDNVGGDKVGGDKVGGDKLSVGNVSGGATAVGEGAQVNITHNYYGQSPATGDQPPPASSQSPSAHSTPEVFISYAWGGQSEAIADKLDAAFAAKGITIVRDKRAVNYKDLIRDFMRRIGQGNCVIVLIGQKYLTSENCMFELIEIAKQGEFKDRIFPIVLSDAKIYRAIGRIPYIQHWEAQIKELEEAMRSVSAANLQGIREDLDLYVAIRNTISNLMDILADMNALTPEIHQESDFAQIIEAVNTKLGNV
ncbi:MAG: toll/interleukin-1 receptor domain-containing protein [Caldilineaceae bacterium]